MSKLFFALSTLLSIAGLVMGTSLLYNHMKSENIGMVAIYIIPLLFIGVVLGGVAYWIKKANDIHPSTIMGFLHKFNLGMMVLGLLGLVYAFMN